MASLLDHVLCFPALEIIEVDGTFFGAAEDADYAPDSSRGLEEREEIEDEAGAGVMF